MSKKAAVAAAVNEEAVVRAQPQVTVNTVSAASDKVLWSSGLYDCMKDIKICLCGTFCPCILACNVAEGFGECLLLPCLSGTLMAIRTGMRERHHIAGTVCNDWVAFTCCTPCALCQLAREMKSRGMA
ncbi:cornifelin homolog A-like [Acipenser ruthenus]|uniref:LOW QUALITY PROTEIN: cornifelin homolog A-like n=1 Tax=Acipenser ruthenus TaxID=7906 RepID=UPI002740DC71|nr:LOW QUALITY PROTEIN: cornifelin homolog A-like [Acipenser ruthenus]XP_058866596.1 cornifelin homolog A-like [Acipenser ruthenus]